jgi:hypothetical protein
MNTQKKLLALYYLVIVMALCFLMVTIVSAQEIGVTASVRFNNENLLTTPQPAPINVGFDFGTMEIIPLEQGKTLIVSRYLLAPEYGVSIFKYQLDDAWWYVTNKGVIYGTEASTDLQALSIYLTK